MGHHYRYTFYLNASGLASLTVDKAFWEMHLTDPTVGKPIFVWDFQITLSNGAAAAGDLAVDLRRTSATFTAGTDHTTYITPITANAPTSGVTIAGGTGGLLTGTLSATLGKLAGFALSTTAVGHLAHRLHFPRSESDNWSPLCVISGADRLVLATTIASPAAIDANIHGSIEWSEGP